MVADSDLPYFRGYSRQRGRGFGALAQTEKIQICGCRCWKQNIT